MGGPYLLGVDIGTLGSKGMITDTDGDVLEQHFVEHPVIYPKRNWAEQDPERHWWHDFVVIVRRLLKKSGVDPKDIAGIGVSGLYYCMCPLDKNGKPVRNAILYLDNRATGQGIRDSIVNLLWMKDNEPTNFAKTRIVLDSTGYLVYKLTNQYSIDRVVVRAFDRQRFRTPPGLFDPTRLEWNDELCKQLGIPVEILPPVYPATKVIGGVSEEAARETHLAKDTPVIVGTADTEMSMLGAGVIERGDAMVLYGTGGFLFARTSDFEESILTGKESCRTISSIQTAGAMLRWFRDEFAHFEMEEERLGLSSYHILDEKAAKIPAGSEGLIVLPYFRGTWYPKFDPLYTGVIFGLTTAHTRVHIYRALLEAFGYNVLHGLSEAKDIEIKRIVATGGGAKSPLWRQILSDIINMPQEYIAKADAPLGDAYLVGYGLGIFKEFKPIKREWLKVTEITKPRPEVHKLYEKLFKIYMNLHIIKDQYKELAEALE